jgi:hypothetical protein
MAKFLLLYTGGSSGMNATEAEQKAIIQAWTDWYTGLGDAVVDPGNPISPMAKSISSDGKTSDKAVGTPATGYTIIAADSLEAAMAMAKGCPHLKAGGQVSVYETFNVM